MTGNPLFVFPSRTGTNQEQARASRPVGSKYSYRRESIAFISEFIGTFLFLFLAFGGTQVANTTAAAENPEAASAGERNNHTITTAPNTSELLYIALSFGFSLAVNVWVFFRVSGGLFNPAVSKVLPKVQSTGLP
jgi:aquaporin rerated protein, other eukaryote